MFYAAANAALLCSVDMRIRIPQHYNGTLDPPDAARPRSSIRRIPQPTAGEMRPEKPVITQLLTEVCKIIQLTPTQAASAREKYEAVGSWLEGDPELRALGIRLYAQGSVAIGTTVRPVGREEHDVDLVAEVSPPVRSSTWLYEKVAKRLEANEIYRRILERRNRCVTLHYAGEFHMDVLSACSAPQLQHPFGATAVLVPDRQLRDWTPSNPLGFRSWFLSRAEGLVAKSVRQAEPLPDQEDPTEMAPLKLAVQLMKRRRDVYLEGRGHVAPRSIVLTTLAGMAYAGQTDLLETLDAVTSSLLEMPIRRGRGYYIPNPANPGENFADGWEPRHFDAFMEFLAQLGDDARRLREISGVGLDEIGRVLAAMFGTEDSKRAVKNLGRSLRAARDDGSLRVDRNRGLAVGGAGIPVRRHDFYGDHR